MELSHRKRRTLSKCGNVQRLDRRSIDVNFHIKIQSPFHINELSANTRIVFNLKKRRPNLKSMLIKSSAGTLRSIERPGVRSMKKVYFLEYLFLRWNIEVKRAARARDPTSISIGNSELCNYCTVILAHLTPREIKEHTFVSPLLPFIYTFYSFENVSSSRGSFLLRKRVRRK